MSLEDRRYRDPKVEREKKRKRDEMQKRLAVRKAEAKERRNARHARREEERIQSLPPPVGLIVEEGEDEGV